MKVLSILALAFAAACWEGPDPDRAPVIVASKTALESVVLSEIAAQRLEAQGCTVERRFRLGDSKALDAQLRATKIDAYAEEFSAAFTKVLGRDLDGQNAAAEPEVRTVYIKRDLVWTASMGYRDSAVVYQKRIDNKCRRASRALMSLGFITTAEEVREMAAAVSKGSDVGSVVRAKMASRGTGR